MLEHGADLLAEEILTQLDEEVRLLVPDDGKHNATVIGDEPAEGVEALPAS